MRQIVWKGLVDGEPLIIYLMEGADLLVTDIQDEAVDDEKARHAYEALILEKLVPKALPHTRFSPEEVITRARQAYLKASSGIGLIQAIKQVRNDTGLGLREAKDFVESMRHEITKEGV